MGIRREAERCSHKGMQGFRGGGVVKVGGVRGGRRGEAGWEERGGRGRARRYRAQPKNEE